MYFSQILSNTLAQPILWQTDTDFGITSFLYNYFFDGIGYWFYFLVLALIAMLWVFYDSSRRNFAATGWRIGTIAITITTRLWKIRKALVLEVPVCCGAVRGAVMEATSGP